MTARTQHLHKCAVSACMFFSHISQALSYCCCISIPGPTLKVLHEIIDMYSASMCELERTLNYRTRFLTLYLDIEKYRSGFFLMLCGLSGSLLIFKIRLRCCSKLFKTSDCELAIIIRAPKSCFFSQNVYISIHYRYQL